MAAELAGFDRAEQRFTRLFVAVAFGFGARMAMITFDGPLARRFTDNGYLIGLLLAVGPLVSTVANPFFGHLSDRSRTRFGRRIPYAVAGVTLSSLVFFALPLAPAAAVLLVLFALRALFASIGGGPLMSLVPDLVAPARRGRAMALFMLAGGLGAIAIQAAGKVFWEKDFALVYYATGLASLLFAVPPLLFIREPRQSAGELAAAGRRGAVSLVEIKRAIAQREPMVLFLLSASLRYLGGGMLMTYFTLFAATDLGVAVGDASLAVAVAGILRLLLALPAGRLADAYDRKRLLLLATVAGGLVHLLTGVLVGNLWQLYLAVAAGTIAGVLEMTAGSPLFMDLLPAERRGELIGINMVLTNIFQSGGALLGGAVFAWTAGYRALFPIAALCFVISAVVLARLTVPAVPTPLAGARQICG
ncbi:MAG: MFS transporter [Deltaproteobacteria bacterium]|nr:MFS transporter [Deltaproteobacteria bacterium]